jgi:hypothetical protein
MKEGGDTWALNPLINERSVKVEWSACLTFEILLLWGVGTGNKHSARESRTAYHFHFPIIKPWYTTQSCSFISFEHNWGGSVWELAQKELNDVEALNNES